MRIDRASLWLCAASGLLCALTSPPAGAWPLAFVAWVPLMLALTRADSARSQGRVLSGRDAVWSDTALRRLTNAGLLGLLQGFVANAAGHYWLIPALVHAGDYDGLQSSSMWFVLCAFQGLRSALISVLVAAAATTVTLRVAAFPLALVLGEWIGWMLLPWYTASWLVARPEFVQLAELGGPLLVSGIIGAINAALAMAVLSLRAATDGRARVRAAARWMGAAVASVAVLWTHGHLRVRAVEVELARSDRLRVAVVHADSGRTSKHNPIQDLRSDTLDAIREQAVDLVIWPETAIDFPVDVAKLESFARDQILRDRRRSITSERLETPLVTGMVVRESIPPDIARATHAGSNFAPSTALYNSAVLFDASGKVQGRYDKRQLLAVGEVAPWSGVLEGIFPAAGHFSAGRRSPALTFSGVRAAVSICYEDLLPEAFRRSVLESRPRLLVNLTSDSWFRGTPGAALHGALAQLRAVEHRRALIRATRDGATAIIAPTGKVLQELAAGDSALVGEAPLVTTRTPFTRYGNAWLWVPALGLMGCAGFSRRRADFRLALHRRFKIGAPSSPRRAR